MLILIVFLKPNLMPITGYRDEPITAFAREVIDAIDFAFLAMMIYGYFPSD
jgi:hypothetical protein